MVLDYKDITFSFKAKKRKKLIERIKIISLIILIIFLYLLLRIFLESKKIKNIQALLVQNNKVDAAAAFNDIENSLFHRDTKKELKALIYLYDDEYEKAEKILENLHGKSTSTACQIFLDNFLDNAKYRRLKVYTDYLLKRGEDTLFYKIMYKTAFLDGRESTGLIKKLPAENREKNSKAIKIIERINKELESGKINYIFDVNGKPLAYYDLKRKTTVSLTAGIGFDEFHAIFNGRLKYFKLTLDKHLQGKLHRLFKNYHGTFLLLNLKDNSIAAAYSKPIHHNKANAVFSEEYEPASIIKVLTLLAHLREGNSKIFPLQCKGNMMLGKKIFYDWWAHDEVASYQDALAVSCNVAFARLGIDLGLPKLYQIFETFYFNSPGFSDQFLNFKTGTLDKNIPDQYHLARFSVGLSTISSTTFHSAVISAIIAQNGTIYSPYLIKNIKNLLNLGFYNHKPKIISVLKDNIAFFKVKEAMTAVVESPRGTGRRSRVDFIQTAVKTGTSGDRNKGYDAMLTGFFPARRSRYAFAFRLERAGKAEVTGAHFLRDFLISFYERRIK